MTDRPKDVIRKLKAEKAKAQAGDKGLEKRLADLEKADAAADKSVEEFSKSRESLVETHKVLKQYFTTKKSMLDSEIDKYIVTGSTDTAKGRIDDKIKSYNKDVEDTEVCIDRLKGEIIDERAKVAKQEVEVAKFQDKFDKFTLLTKSASDAVKMLGDVQKSIEEHDPKYVPLMYLQLHGLFQHHWEYELAHGQTFSKFDDLKQKQLRESLDAAWNELNDESKKLDDIRNTLAEKEASLEAHQEKLKDLVSNRGKKLIDEWYQEQAFELQSKKTPEKEPVC